MPAVGGTVHWRAGMRRLASGTCVSLGLQQGLKRGVPGGTMSKLLMLMRELGSDAALAEEYRRDPDGVMRHAGLPDEERRAMLDKDIEAIKRLTGLAEGRFAAIQTTVISYED